MHEFHLNTRSSCAVIHTLIKQGGGDMAVTMEGPGPFHYTLILVQNDQSTGNLISTCRYWILTSSKKSDQGSSQESHVLVTFHRSAYLNMHIKSIRNCSDTTCHYSLQRRKFIISPFASICVHKSLTLYSLYTPIYLD